ncbi:MAG: DUF927 domain-containing protein [Planktomarina sp.]
MSKDDVKKQIDAGLSEAETKKTTPPKQGKAKRKRVTRPFPFKVDDGGVYRKVETEEDGQITAKWVWFMSPVRVLALTRSEENEDWGKLLEITDRDGVNHVWPMPASMMGGQGEPVRGELLRLGADIAATRNARAWVLEYLISANPDDRARCVERIGWHGEKFILPDGAIQSGDASEVVIMQTTEKLDHAYNVKGDLDAWRDEVAALAVGNSRLILSIAAGFAGPMMALSGDEGGGFHFRGASSSGKSTALIMGGSVWGGGGPRGYMRQWRATDNALEAVAAGASDSLLCLDELSQIDAKAAGPAAYMLANGRGKARSGKEGQARKVAEWRVMFLSNGELSLADKIAEGGGHVAAGQEVRVIDMRADADAGMGIFENIHGSQDPSDFSQRIKRVSNEAYGTAGRALVAALVEDLPTYREKLAGLRKAFVAAVVPYGSDGQVKRVADRFALIAAAGEIATALGITGWPEGEAHNAARRCFGDWLTERGGIGSSEVAEAKRRIIETIDLHGKSKFQRFDIGNTDRAIVTDRHGFVKIEEDASGAIKQAVYLFNPSAMKAILKGLDRQSIIAQLVTDGSIVARKKKSGEFDPCPLCRVPSDNKRSQRLYQIDLNALDGGADTSDDA